MRSHSGFSALFCIRPGMTCPAHSLKAPQHVVRRTDTSSPQGGSAKVYQPASTPRGLRPTCPLPTGLDARHEPRVEPLVKCPPGSSTSSLRQCWTDSRALRRAGPDDAGLLRGHSTRTSSWGKMWCFSKRPGRVPAAGAAQPRRSLATHGPGPVSTWVTTPRGLWAPSGSWKPCAAWSSPASPSASCPHVSRRASEHLRPSALLGGGARALTGEGVSPTA